MKTAHCSDYTKSPDLSSFLKPAIISYFKKYYPLNSYKTYKKTPLTFKYRHIIYILFWTLLLSVSSCRPKGTIRPSIALSFDDNYIDEWYAHKNLFARYNARVTFCLSNIEQLDSIKIEKLKQLRNEGHEIANHSYSHTNPRNFIEKNSITEYLDQEVDKQDSILKQLGFTPTSFALPFGISTQELIDSLQNRYNYTRGATFNIPYKLTRKKKTLDKFNNIFVYNTGAIYSEAMGVDYNFENRIKHVIPALERCLSDSICLVLYAHRINTSNEDYSVSPFFLDSLFNIISEMGVEFKTLSEL